MIRLRLLALSVCATLCLFSDTRAQSRPVYGDQAPEISLPSVTGDTTHLSSLKGKVVLIDFWASWCGPCRTSNRNLARLYAKYKDKGFEIFSISLDENRDDWQKAIKRDKITWTQVIDDRGKDAATAIDWRVYQLPTSYIMDKSGNLVAMDLEGKALETFLGTLLN